MFWSPKPTIDTDDMQWQLAAWEWLLDNLGGVERLKSFPSKYPTQRDFPKSGLSGHAHVRFVLDQLCTMLQLDPSGYELVAQEQAPDPRLGPLAVVQNMPRGAAGTYRMADNRHIVTYEPGGARDLERLIAVMVHELCHSVLFSFPTLPPGGADHEEFATDLAVVFFGFGVFGGNQSFQFRQYRDDSTGTQGWATRRLGYLTQNEWGFALAVRASLTGEEVTSIEKYASDGLLANFRKNHKYLTKNRDKIATVTGS
jgi:hypothetical protein